MAAKVVAGMVVLLLMALGASGARISSSVQLSAHDQGVAHNSSEVVHKFCDVSRLHMQDLDSGVEGSSVGIDKIMKGIVDDIKGEVENNNMEEAAREMATFYTCVRWVPDGSYQELVEAEQTVGTFNVTTKDEGPVKAAEAYQKFKFVPIRCSKNLAVWQHRSDGPDGTFFEQFERETNEVAKWLSKGAKGDVAKGLADVDRAFCPDRVRKLTGGDKGMGSEWCELSAQSWARWMLADGSSTRRDRWNVMAGKSSSMGVQNDSSARVLDLEVGEVTGYVIKGASGYLRGQENVKMIVSFGSDTAKFKFSGDDKYKSLSVRGNVSDTVTVKLYDRGWLLGSETLLAEGSTSFAGSFGSFVSGEEHTFTMTLTDHENHQYAKKEKGVTTPTTVEFTVKIRDPVTDWNKDIESWTDFFPYSSFIASNAPGLASPEPEERVLLCFGKRVASELHRRPSGSHILADMNNLGCHGFWTMEEAAEMMVRMVQLWRPPTCQLAELRYRMKSEMVKLATEMNTRFFEALPSMLLSEELGTVTPHHKHTIEIDGQTYIEGMHVQKKGHPDMQGAIVIKDGKLCVSWDHNPLSVLPVEASEIAIVVKEDDQSWYQRLTQGFSERLTSMRDVVATVSDFLYQRLGQVDSKMYKLSALMSRGTAKWSVCPINASSDMGELDASLGNEDVNFREWLQDAYARYGGEASKLPGKSCVEADFLDSSKFGQCKVCNVASMLADHLEKYKGEQFVCPSKPLLDPAEQLEVLREHDHCLLHMSERQMAVAAWHYNGRHPLAKQFDRTENSPSDEMRLMKLLKISRSDGAKQVEMGLSCTLQEWQEMPRFCELPQIHNPSSDLASMASWLAAILSDGSVSGLGAVTSLMSGAKGLWSNITREDTSKAGLEHAVAIFEGALRHAKSGGKAALGFVGNLMDDVGTARKQHLAKKLLGTSPAAELLHSASFQRSLRNPASTTGSTETFDRYVVTCPCDSFDPVGELGARTVWGEVALRLLRQVYQNRPNLVGKTALSVQLRGVAALHRKEQQYTNKEETAWIERTVVAAATDESSTSKPLPASQWWAVSDQGLTGLVGGVGHTNHLDISGGALESVTGAIGLKGALQALRGLEATVWCAKKRDFPKGGGTPPADAQSLEDCIQTGMASNEELYRKSPTKQYFPDEVVVVVAFAELTRRECQPVADAAGHASDALCGSGAQQEQGLLSFFGEAASLQGVHAGAGFPKNTLAEVVLRPEDAAKELGLPLESSV